MALLDDLAKELVTEAGKTGPDNQAVAKSALLETIEVINKAIDYRGVATRKEDLSISAGAWTVTIPAKVKRMIEFGEYDSTNDKLLVKFDESRESDFHAEISGNATFETMPSGSFRWWFIRDYDKSMQLEIGVYPMCTGAITCMARYYEDIDEGNIGRLKCRAILRAGAKVSLAGWFPQTASFNYQRFKDLLDILNAERPSMGRSVVERQSPDIALHNALGASLVS